MSKRNILTMFGKVLRNHGGLLTDLVEKLDKDPGKWEPAICRTLRKENPWEAVKAIKSKLLKFLGTVTLAATTERFVAKDKFKVGIGDDVAVKIRYISDNFTDFFLTGEGKTEEPIPETTINYYKLKKDSIDGPIIAELGGETVAETFLTEMFALMAMQSRGEKGVLITNGKANIFYICDTKGVLRAVDASSVSGPSRWHGGRQVFSRN